MGRSKAAAAPRKRKMVLTGLPPKSDSKKAAQAPSKPDLEAENPPPSNPQESAAAAGDAEKPAEVGKESIAQILQLQRGQKAQETEAACGGSPSQGPGNEDAGSKKEESRGPDDSQEAPRQSQATKEKDAGSKNEDAGSKNEESDGLDDDDAFNFDETYSALSSGSITPKAQPKRGKQKAAELQVQDEECEITDCDEPVAKGSPYCWPHKRGFGRICKQAMTGKVKKTQQYMDYIKIFGEGRKKPDDPHLAHRVIADVTAGMESGGGDDDPARKRHKPNHQIELGQYIHAKGRRTSTDDVKPRVKYDFELFVHKMKQCRGSVFSYT